MGPEKSHHCITVYHYYVSLQCHAVYVCIDIYECDCIGYAWDTNLASQNVLKVELGDVPTGAVKGPLVQNVIPNCQVCIVR